MGRGWIVCFPAMDIWMDHTTNGVPCYHKHAITLCRTSPFSIVQDILISPEIAWLLYMWNPIVTDQQPNSSESWISHCFLSNKMSIDAISSSLCTVSDKYAIFCVLFSCGHIIILLGSYNILILTFIVVSLALIHCHSNNLKYMHKMIL